MHKINLRKFTLISAKKTTKYLDKIAEILYNRVDIKISLPNYGLARI